MHLIIIATVLIMAVFVITFTVNPVLGIFVGLGMAYAFNS